jgi:hypothetical protein
MVLRDTEWLWKPLLEATAQTMVGVIGAYAAKEISSRFYKDNSFDGPLDLWKRGIHKGKIESGDRVAIDCLISPYTQLFPGDPFNNAKAWRSLYQFDGKISTKEFQAMEFYVAKDETLRIGSLNGETLVGIYGRYGYVGDGLIGVVSTTYLKKQIPHFFSKEYFGTRAVLYGVIERCPSQHGFVARGIAEKAGITIDGNAYTNLPYLNVTKIKLFRDEKENVCTLLGSPWAVTDLIDEQYIVQYGQLDAPNEIESCINQMKGNTSWENVQVFFDDLADDSKEVSFRRIYL